ncbi:MAG: glutamine--fructose-6-phosphate transaminase (isomerizing) [Flavobacteriales bacterium]|nr:glutamine--fructose-6-phosphate transaminase (isomerizing) [Flavobacteriales bacterium]|tara:strand:+ start:13402 stop:15240 length:1839 start_codon:yes stop_codon:yes gene_type:complete
MCGIVAYNGKQNAIPLIISGLERLEYRGYDSAGIAWHNTKNLEFIKKSGKVKVLKSHISTDLNAQLAIGHTRWATHGKPSDENAHPHFSIDNNLAIIHNGIIENYAAIKEGLQNRGYKFKSQTDTEVLINLIQDVKKNEKTNLFQSVQLALSQIIGAYAIAVIDTNSPNSLVVAKKGSPLLIGVGDEEYFVASDAAPFIQHTKNVIYLNDGEIAEIGLKHLEIRTISNELKTPYIQKLNIELDQIEKGDYETFMLKEIYEQPNAILETLRGRISPDFNFVKLRGVNENIEFFQNTNKITIVACGTSWHAGLVGEYLIEGIAKVPVEVEYASEFLYRNPLVSKNDIVIAISQSGETADTLSAISLAKKRGAFVYGICNVVGSSIARATTVGTYMHAGPEIGVASTKSFTSQVTTLVLMALSIGKLKKSISDDEFQIISKELFSISKKIQSSLDSINKQTQKLAKLYKNAKNFLYLGRGISFPVALEGALKLKEISYIHAEGYPAAEMKHGPIALIDKNMPTVIIATNKPNYEKVVANAEEIKARSGKLIAIVSQDDNNMNNIADHIIQVPETHDFLTPLITAIPLQLLSYHIAKIRGCDVDQPRNLAKSVTVE